MNGQSRLFPITVGFFAIALFLFSCGDDNGTGSEGDGIITEMVLIPTTTFSMGTDSSISKQASPVLSVSLNAYYIDKYEVTMAEYKEFLEAMNWEDSLVPFDNGTWDTHGIDSSYVWVNHQIPDGKANHPVVGLDWYDAKLYCEWLGKRLPTEAEWELAARGTDGRVFPWGNSYDPSRLNDTVGGEETTPVGSYPTGASPYGLLDMAGNAFEWTSSLKVAYPGNTWYEGSDYYIVMRGGSFSKHDSGDWLYEVFWRSGNGPTRHDKDAGCRCAKTAP